MPKPLRQLTHATCGSVLNLVYVPRPSKDRDKHGNAVMVSEPALSCPQHGVIVDLSEVNPPGSMCLVSTEEVTRETK